MLSLYSSMRVLPVRNSIQLFSFPASKKTSEKTGLCFSRAENYEKSDHLFQIYEKSTIDFIKFSNIDENT